jgi:type IV pilus assembly protein PilQ
VSALLLALLLATAGDGEARISLDLKDAPVEDVMRVLSEVGGFQLVMDHVPPCTLTLKLTDVRWIQALDLSLRACSLDRQEEGDVIRVATLARFLEESAARRRLDEEREKAPAGRLSLFRLSYARASQMAPLLKRLLAPRGDVYYDERTNTVIIID